MPLPTLPSTHRWVDGGLVAAVAGRSLTVPSQESRIFVWDLDTDARVVDLYDQNGYPVDSIPLVDNTFRAGVPTTVGKPVFSVGQNGYRFAGNDWQAVADARSAADDAAASAALVGAPADDAIATAVQGPGTQTKAALDAAYGTLPQQQANTDDIAALKSGGGAASKANRADVDLPFLWNVDGTRLHGPVSPNALLIPTPDSPAGGQVTHPSVVFIPNGFNGYRFWMAITPYPGGNDDYEDPCIVASNDGTNWVVPDGLTNPLDDQTGQPEYNSDVNLVYGPDGRLYLFFRFYDPNALGAEENLYLMSSDDGVTWGTKQLILTNDQAVRRLVAPTVVYDNGRWVMWACDIVPTPNRIVRLEAAAPEGPWSQVPQDCTLSATVAGKEPWHLEVRVIGGLYVGLLADCTSGTNGSSPDLTIITSTDGIAWTGSSQPIIPKAQAGEHDQLYKSSFWPKVLEDGTLGFDVWYVGWLTGPPSVWNLYRTEVTAAPELPTVYSSKGGGPSTATNSGTVTAISGFGTITFVAPDSGIIRVDGTCYLKHSASGTEAGMQVEIKQGSTQVWMDTIASGYDTIYDRASGHTFITGLTPGATYTANAYVRSGGAGTATGVTPMVTITPLVGIAGVSKNY